LTRPGIDVPHTGGPIAIDTILRAFAAFPDIRHATLATGPVDTFTRRRAIVDDHVAVVVEAIADLGRRPNAADTVSELAVDAELRAIAAYANLAATDLGLTIFAGQRAAIATTVGRDRHARVH
jgi:hypothetical protein